MYRKRIQCVADHLVSIQQPWILPFARGKTDKPIKFGTRFDLRPRRARYEQNRKNFF